MGTLMDKLNATNATKEQIRQAIERKKVSVPENTPLKDYPAKIDGIYPDALFLDKNINLAHTCTKLTYGATKSCEGIVNGEPFCIRTRNIACSSSYLYCTKTSPWQIGNFPSRVSDGDCAFGNGLFMVVSSNTCGYNASYIYTSSDGVNWTKIIPNITGYFNTVLFVEGYFYVIGRKQRDSSVTFVMKSKDGKSFSELGQTSINLCNRSGNLTHLVRYVSDTKKFVCVDGSDRIYLSNDCVNWSFKDFDGWSGYAFCDFIYADKKYVFMTDDGYVGFGDDFSFLDKIYVDPCNTVWSSIQNGGILKYFNGRFIVRTNKGIAYSSDLVNWERVQLETKWWFALYEFSNTLYIVSENSNKDIYNFKWSRDGVTWVNSINCSIVDSEGNDKSTDVLNALLAIETATLQAAYQAGVNSI